MQATRRSLSDGRWHFQHGPIDLVLQVDGDEAACQQALSAAWARFQNILPELVRELPLLRSPVDHLQENSLHGPVARRMQQAAHDLAWATPDGFVTPMAAVAGAVAQEVLDLLAVQGVRRASVNNGGDIALFLQRGQSWRVGLVSDLPRALAADAQQHMTTDGQFEVHHDMPVRGVATSGWGGRSFSFGVADSVTVLAETAAQADVAATLIANAVNLQHPGIVRRPANSLRDDTDLGDRWVTVDVPRLPPDQVQAALQLGLDCARDMQARGQLHAACLCCQSQLVLVHPMECLV